MDRAPPALPPCAEHATDCGSEACPRCLPLDVAGARGSERSGTMKRDGEAMTEPIIMDVRTASRSRPPKRRGVAEDGSRTALTAPPPNA
jgi:hypothetical protein